MHNISCPIVFTREKLQEQTEIQNLNYNFGRKQMTTNLTKIFLERSRSFVLIIHISL